jgi:hypothetical protein
MLLLYALPSLCSRVFTVKSASGYLRLARDSTSNDSVHSITEVLEGREVYSVGKRNKRMGEIILYNGQQMHNYLTNYHTATCSDTIVSSSDSL